MKQELEVNPASEGCKFRVLYQIKKAGGKGGNFNIPVDCPGTVSEECLYQKLHASNSLAGHKTLRECANESNSS